MLLKSIICDIIPLLKSVVTEFTYIYICTIKSQIKTSQSCFKEWPVFEEQRSPTSATNLLKLLLRLVEAHWLGLGFSG